MNLKNITLYSHSSKGKVTQLLDVTNKFDYTSTEERLGTVSDSDNGHSIDVINLLHRFHIPIPHDSFAITMTCVNVGNKPLQSETQQ